MNNVHGLPENITHAHPGRIKLPPLESTGFLTPTESAGLFHADVYIAAIARSGSTLICGLLTYPPDHLCLVEPWFIWGMRGQACFRQLQRFGLRITERDWLTALFPREKASFVRRYGSFIAPHLASVRKWGAKEVRPEFHLPTIETINPRFVLVLVRDIRDVVRSLARKQAAEGMDESESTAWISGYCTAAAPCLLRLRSRPRSITVRYEDFVASEAARADLGGRLDWPLVGRVNADFDLFGRGSEAAAHRGRVSPAVHPQSSEWVEALAEEMHARCADYQGAFCYD